MNSGKAVFPKSFILRITKEEWYKQVFSIKKYYPGIRRIWEPDGVIFLARKAEEGDSFVGFGILKEFLKRDALPENERQECEKMGWSGALVFSKLYRFDPPLPIKETVLSGLNVKGRFFHGYPLTKEQVDSILNKAKEKSAFRRID